MTFIAKCQRCGGSATSEISFEDARKKINHAVALSRGIKCGDNYGRVVEIIDENKTKSQKKKPKQKSKEKTIKEETKEEIIKEETDVIEEIKVTDVTKETTEETKEEIDTSQ